MSVPAGALPPAFAPRRWLRNGHVQTIAGNFLPRTVAEGQELPAPSEELFLVSAADEPESRVLCLCHWQPEPASRLTVLLLHGLEGSAHSQYIVGNARKLWHAGMNVIRMNMRNCGGTETLTPTLYHSGMSGDVRAVLAACLRERGLRRTALVGYSMGGNIVLKLAGELGHSRGDTGHAASGFGHAACGFGHADGVSATLRAAVGVSPALDLAASAAALHDLSNRIYERRFLAGLRQRFERKAQLFPGRYDPARADGLRSLRDFDERITAFYSGFGGATDYYYRAAAARVLDEIRVPTLILHAADDPFVRITPESRAALGVNPHIALVEPAHGGHCAFLAQPAPGEDGYWAEAATLRFLLAVS